jgi:hypothetical protein
MSGFAAERRPTPVPFMVQRRCPACGGSGSVVGTCSACAGGPSHVEVPEEQHWAPSSVVEVVKSAGSPLDPATRNAMESAFHRDFSAVRVHADGEAAASVRAVAAQAYTVGQNIVFGAGRYDPGSDAGRRLIAHELGHTLQQPSGGTIPNRLPIGLAHSSSEREADAMADAAMMGDAAVIAASVSAPQMQLQRFGGFGDVRIAEGLQNDKDAEEARRKEQFAPGNMAGRILTDDDIAKAGKASGAASPGRVTPTLWNANFVLHDTASKVGAKKIAEHASHGRRSSGEGAAAWVPQSGAATIAHSPLFGPRRPAATQHERGEDVMKKAMREKEYRGVWKATARDVRESTLDDVLSGQGSPAAEAKTERAQAIADLDAGSGLVHSAAAWTVEDICQKVTSATAPNLAASPSDVPNLEGGCQRLLPLFNMRALRVGSSVNIELVQEQGSDCRTTGTLTPLTPYSTSQMDNVKSLYLNAALQARAFPSITTHFQIDKAAGDHCDPRCFNVTALYKSIQADLGHPAGCTYGIMPVYGTGGTDNVWWNDTVCGGAHP